MLPILAAVLAFITIGGLGWVFVGGDDSSAQAVKRAQDAVNKAREEAKHDAEGYARTLRGLSLDEESARLAVEVDPLLGERVEALLVRVRGVDAPGHLRPPGADLGELGGRRHRQLSKECSAAGKVPAATSAA